MKLIHVSDLHIGKRVNEFSMLEDQEYILKKIINIIIDEKPDGVIIAGDIYDKPVPSGEAVQLFDNFLVRLSQLNLKIFIISGNHDSPERIAFGSRLLKQSGIYMSPVYDGHILPVSLKDEYGNIDIFMLPFIKPIHVRKYFPDSEIDSYNDAVKTAIDNMPINPNNRSILITHQFVTGASRSESEEISVGGSDNIDAVVFEPFDYVALGHIHSPQNVGKSTIRYCGTPLKYSFSEVNNKKSLTVVELYEKGNVTVSTIPLTPKREMREISGKYMEITKKDFYKDTCTDDYLHIILTDEEDIPDVIGKLRVIYPNIMKLSYDNKRTRANVDVSGAENVERKMPLELFCELYEKQNNQEMSQEQLAFTSRLIKEIWEDEL